MIRPEMQIRRRDRSDSPLCLRRERRGLVVTRSRGDDFVAVFVDGARRRRGQLRVFLGLFLDLGDLLALRRRGGDLHAENDVSDFGLGQGGHVDTVDRNTMSLLSFDLFHSMMHTQVDREMTK